jgi:salicylate hydroxylase
MSPTPVPKPLTIAIIGGGLSGLALSIGLLHHPHIQFQIYESAPSFSEIGAGIMFGPHAVNALRLLHPEALEAFKKCVTYNEDEGMKWLWPTFRYGTDRGGGWELGGEIAQISPSEDVGRMIEVCGTKTMSAVHRARFLDECVKILPEGRASFGKNLVGIEEAKEGVKMTFADGTDSIADAVIGCDGIKSRTRAILFPNVEPKYAGEYAYRSLIDVKVVKEIMGEQLGGNANLWMGHGGYIINYPVEQGRLVNVVGVRRNHDKESKHSYDKLVTPVSREEMYEDWKDWDPRLQQLYRKFKTSDQWSLWDLPHEEKYYRGRICLMGDGAHAALPHLGSGAGMCMEDAYILSNLLGTAKKADDLEKIFEVYDAVRRPRTQKLVLKSRESGLYSALEMTENVEDAYKALQVEFPKLYSWVWGFDLEGSLREAKAILGSHSWAINSVPPSK